MWIPDASEICLVSFETSLHQMKKETSIIWFHSRMILNHTKTALQGDWAKLDMLNRKTSCLESLDLLFAGSLLGLGGCNWKAEIEPCFSPELFCQGEGMRPVSLGTKLPVGQGPNRRMLLWRVNYNGQLSLGELKKQADKSSLFALA